MQDTHHLNLVGGSLATAPTLGLASPGYEIPPLRGWLKPLQDPTPVKRARTVTRMPGVLNHARFTPIRPTNPPRERHGLPTLATVLPPPASRPTPNQRGEVLCRLSSAGYCLPPTAQLPITERGPISTSEPSQSPAAGEEPSP